MTEWNQVVTHDATVVSKSAYFFSSNRLGVHHSSFLSNPLSGITPLKPVDAVSIFIDTSVQLAGINHQVSP